MTTFKFSFYFSCFFVFFSCSSDSTHSSENETIEISTENINNIIDDLSPTTVDTISQISTLSTEENKEIEIVQKERIEIIKEQIKDSPVAAEYKSDCDAILNKYKEIVERYVASEDVTILDEIISFPGDPIFEHCRGHKDYKSKFDKIDELME